MPISQLTLCMLVINFVNFCCCLQIFFQKIFFSSKNYSRKSIKHFGSRSGQTVSGLIWIQTVCKGYPQMTSRQLQTKSLKIYMYVLHQKNSCKDFLTLTYHCHLLITFANSLNTEGILERIFQKRGCSKKSTDDKKACNITQLNQVEYSISTCILRPFFTIHVYNLFFFRQL